MEKKTSLGRKEKATTRKKKITKWKSSLAKANSKVGNHPQINMISKLVIVRGGVYK